MTDIIDTAQVQDIADALIDLFEIELDSSTIYIYPGLIDGTDSIYFPSQGAGTNLNEYIAIPMSITGVELNADGAQNRPIWEIANVLGFAAGANESTLSTELAGLTNDDLIGKKITRRRTFGNNTYTVADVSGWSATAPVEFPIKSYIIDRIASENSVSVTFELSSPFDVEGIKLPNRVVVGKYCSWQYQGYYSTPSVGGCPWKLDGKIKHTGDAIWAIQTNYAFFTVDDEPIIRDDQANAQAYPTGQPYAQDDIVSKNSRFYRSNIASNSVDPEADTVEAWQVMRQWDWWDSGTTYTPAADPKDGPYVKDAGENLGGTIWRCVRESLNEAPVSGSAYWTRGDVCGKTVNSCKLRFQFQNRAQGGSWDTQEQAVPSVKTDTAVPLPFGGFPGVTKFR